MLLVLIGTGDTLEPLDYRVVVAYASPPSLPLRSFPGLDFRKKSGIDKFWRTRLQQTATRSFQINVGS